MKTTPITITLVLLACGCSNRNAHISPLHTAVPLDDGFVELRLEGLVANAEPEGIRAKIEWLPTDTTEIEGAWVKPGDEVVKFNREMLDTWVQYESLEVQKRKAMLGLLDAKAAREIGELEEERGDLEHARKVLNAEIEATRRKDQAEIAIAESRVALAKHKVEQARRRLDRLEHLDRQDVSVGRELLEARDAYSNAVEALRVPVDQLDYLQNVTFATSRRLLELERDAVEIDLGSPSDEYGVFSKLSVRQQRKAYDMASTHRDWRKRKRRTDRLRDLREDGALRANSEGVVRHREGGINAGDFTVPGSVVFVLKDEDMGFTFDLPARWRNVIDAAGPDHLEAGRVFVDVPQLVYRQLPGRIESIAARPYDTGGGPAYRCSVRLDEPVPGLLERLRVNCRIRVVVPRNATAIPAWAVSDPHDPQVNMSDGSLRSISGYVVGHRFIVTDGIEAGEKVCAIPKQEQDQPVHLTGIVEARESIDLRVPWRMEILDMLPEGSAVEMGDVIAHMVPLRGKQGEDMLEKADHVQWIAETEFQRMQLDAVTRRHEDYAAWRKAFLNVEAARLQYLVERYASFLGEVEADVKREHAAIALRAAKRRLVETEGAAQAGTRSAQAVREARLKAEHSRLELAKAELDAVSFARLRDWSQVWELRAACFDAEEEAARLRHKYSEGRKWYRMRLVEILDKYRTQMDEVLRWRRDLERLTVRAPRSGHVYYNFDRWNSSTGQRPLKTGRPLRNTAPFFMPVNLDRRVRIEVPERFRDRFTLGQKVQLHAPALGTETVGGVVSDISYHFHESKAASEEYLLSGTVGTLSRVFTAQVDLELTPKQAGRVKPGVTAWMEIAL